MPLPGRLWCISIISVSLSLKDTRGVTWAMAKVNRIWRVEHVGNRSRLRFKLVDVGMREPTLLSLLDKRTVPPWTLWIFCRMSLNDYVLNEREVDIALSVIWEERSDSDR